MIAVMVTGGGVYPWTTKALEKLGAGSTAGCSRLKSTDLTFCSDLS